VPIGWLSGFVNELLLGGFGFLSGFFWVSGFLCFSGFRFLSGFFLDFGFRVHPWVKNEIRTRTRFCTGQVWIQLMGVKMNLNPHPSDIKPVGDSKHKPELSSLTGKPQPI
jgi:hypothetical protein